MKSMLTRLAASATISILMLAGIFAGAPAQAGGSTHASCSNVFVQVICIGTINNNPITITIGDINILNGNQINILNVQENNLLNNVASENDIQTQVNDIASGNVVILKDVLNIFICQVKVVEIGVINTNIAKCN